MRRETLFDRLAADPVVRGPRATAGRRFDVVACGRLASTTRTSIGVLPTDEELVGAMARGDRCALGLLYDRYADALGRTAFAIVREHATACDLAHDALMEAWQRAGQYRRERGSVRTWLMLRVRSRALDHVRSSPVRRTVALTSGDRGHDPVDPVDVSARPDEAIVRRALEHLSDGQRQVIELGYFQGLSSSEMATELGVPIGTVKSRAKAALERLRAMLAEEQGR